jgi:lipopolysaccharide export system protein LptC
MEYPDAAGIVCGIGPGNYILRTMTAGQTSNQVGGATGMQTRPKPETSAARAAAFRRAQKHSRKVQFLKFVLPAAAILIAGSFAAYSYVSVPGSVSFDISESAYTDGKLVMANPKLDGYTKESRPYSMSATRALQHIDNSGIVDLEGIDARLPVSATEFAMIGAARGIYDREKNTLDIPSAITVKTTDGMTAILQSAYLEIGQGNLRTKDPVDIKLDGAQIVADAMSVLENGKVLIFEKRVRMNLTPARLKGRQVPSVESLTNDAQD